MYKYDNETKKQIKYWKQIGLSNRDIAGMLGISKSGVSDFLKKEQGPKVLLIDVETAPSIAVSFQRFNVNITPDHVLQEGDWLLTASWKWLNKKKVEGISLSSEEALDKDDSRICDQMNDLFDEADIIVAHNGKRFDVPIIKTRMLANGFSPPHSPKIIDTLLIARSLKFSSNKLDSLCHSLDIGRKMKHHGIRLWIDCMNGNQDALDNMLEYNKRDVELLEELYLEIRPYDKTGPNFGQYYNDGKEHCPTCGSTHLLSTGKNSYTNVGMFEELVCNTCGHRSSRKQMLNIKDHRKQLLRRSV